MEKQRSAVVSADGRYRYRLERRWADGPTIAFVMLNPSTADAELDDPTLRRCIGFARAWGMGGLVVGNLYALRATDPRALRTAEDPVGPENDGHLLRLAAEGLPIVAAWGAHARPDRVAAVSGLPGFDRLLCLARTKAGAPRHPLYLAGGLEPLPWRPTR